MLDVMFVVGDKVTPLYTSDYHLTMGKVYDVVKYEPAFYDEGFTWPAYVEIIDDRGKLAVAHARRFRAV